MKLKCPHCQRSLNIPEHVVGRKVNCPACQQRFVVPAPAVEGEPKRASVPEPATVPKPNSQERGATHQSLPASANLDRHAEGNAAAVETTTSPPAHKGHILLARVRSAFQTSGTGATSQSSDATRKIKGFATWATQRGLAVAGRVREETFDGVQFYRTHHEAFWKQLWSGPLRFWKGEESLAQDIELFLPDRERIEAAWTVDLPNRCVACGIETTQPECQHVRTLENFTITCRVIWVALAVTIVLLWWQPTIGTVRLGWWLAPLFFAAATLVAFRMRQQESATVRFCCCSEHAQNDRYPKLFLVSGGLLVRVGTARAKRRLQDEHQDRGRQRLDIPADEIHSPPIPLPASLDGTEFDTSPAPDARRTIALVQDVEPTPILHTVSTLAIAADLPIVAPPIVESTAPTALLQFSVEPPPFVGVTVEEVGTSSNTTECHGDEEIPEGVLVEDDEIHASSNALPVDHSSSPTSGADMELIPDCVAADPNEDEEVKMSVGDRVQNEDVPLQEILGAPFRNNLLHDGFQVGFRYLLQILGCLLVAFCFAMINAASASKHLMDSSIDSLTFVGVVTIELMVFLFFILRAVSVLYAYYFWTAETFENGGTNANDPRPGLADLAHALAVTLISSLPLAAVAYALSQSNAPSGLDEIRAFLTSNPQWAFWIVGAAGASLLYWPMGMAVAGAYRSLNPFRVILAILRSFPLYMLVLVWMIPIVAVTAGIAFGINLLGLELVALAPQEDQSRLMYLAAVISLFVSFGFSQFPVLALFAMLGLILRRYRGLLAPRDRKNSGRWVFVFQATVLIAFTCFLIAFVVPKVPGWFSKLGQMVAVQYSFEPWTANQEVAVQQLEAKGAKVLRTPKMITERHNRFVETWGYDKTIGKYTRIAGFDFAEIHIDLGASSVTDDDIPAIVQLKGDGTHKELKRVVVRGSKLSQDGISQLRNALPKTVLEE